MQKKPQRNLQQNKSTGSRGEALAAQYLTEKGYVIVDRNFSCHWGELDLIAHKPNGTLAFIEVKSRSSERYGRAYEAVNPRKLSHLTRAIQFYLLKKNYPRSKLSLEVIGVQMNSDPEKIRIYHYDDLAVEI